jgi:isocitrate/isopropylmalate dehydrogenase
MTDGKTSVPEPAIAVIPADGIGGEVLDVGRAVVEAAAGRSGAFRVRWTEFPWGCDYYVQHGRMMAADGLDQLRRFDAIYFGAVGWPTVPDHISLWGLRLAICQGLDLWANVRPVTFLPGVSGPLRKTGLTGTSWVVVRENSLEPARRHPVRPGQRAVGQLRPRVQREPQPGTPRAQHVRAGARLGAEHRGEGDREPHRRSGERRDALLDHLGYRSEAGWIQDAIRCTVADGVITPDLGGSSTSAEFRDQLVGRIGQAEKL